MREGLSVASGHGPVAHVVGYGRISAGIGGDRRAGGGRVATAINTASLRYCATGLADANPRLLVEIAEVWHSVTDGVCGR